MLKGTHGVGIALGWQSRLQQCTVVVNNKGPKITRGDRTGETQDLPERRIPEGRNDKFQQPIREPRDKSRQ